MNDSEAVDGLKRLGLTTYEARVFLGLQKLGSGTANEVSDVVDVPRSQVYGAAEDLEQRGLVETQQSTPTVYRPVPPGEARKLLLDQLTRTGSETFEYLERIQDTRDYQERSESIWLINTEEAIISRTVTIAERADNRVLYAAETPGMLEADLLAALGTASDGGASVVVASAEPAVLEEVPDGRFETNLIPDERDMDVSIGRLLVADGRTVLLSTLSTDATGNSRQEIAFWTSDNPFATVFVELVEAWFGEPFD